MASIKYIDGLKQCMFYKKQFCFVFKALYSQNVWLWLLMLSSSVVVVVITVVEVQQYFKAVVG